MKVAFVVQRYGADVLGGSESYCRQMAERLRNYWDIEILTTCAKDYMTWKDEYDPGLCRVDGIAVRRFRVDFPRTVALFNRIYCALCAEHNEEKGEEPGIPSRELEERWIMEQGPYSSDFIRYIDSHSGKYDAFVFFTYLYGLSYYGLPKVSHKSVLVPTAHDEPPFHLSIFKDFFRLPRGFIFLTPEERELVRKVHGTVTPDIVVGVGVDPAPQTEIRKLFSQYGNEIKYPFILYIGRIDESKGCKSLFENFIRFKEDYIDIKVSLVLAGSAWMDIPEHPDIVSLGFVDDKTKSALIEESELVVMPSIYESLSMVILESWDLKTPVLVNGKCEVLRGQCERSGGGIAYESYEDFKDGLNRLLDDDDLRVSMGIRGNEYVRKNYSWETVIEKFRSFVEINAISMNDCHESISFKGKSSETGLGDDPKSEISEI